MSFDIFGLLIGHEDLLKILSQLAAPELYTVLHEIPQCQSTDNLKYCKRHEGRSGQDNSMLQLLARQGGGFLLELTPLARVPVPEGCRELIFFIGQFCDAEPPASSLLSSARPPWHAGHSGHPSRCFP